MKKIDFVITWVDDTDTKWQEEREMYTPKKNSSDNRSARFRDLGTLKYVLRSIEKYTPWVNKVFLVTAGHLPNWLSVQSPKLVTVRHDEFIPEKYLPTFNSNTIELNLHRIKGLSEDFVLFNDDMLLNTKLEPEDFFLNDLPRDFGIYNAIPPMGEFSNIVMNNMIIINRFFNKRQTFKKNWRKFIRLSYGVDLVRSLLTLPWKPNLGYLNYHVVQSHRKTIFNEVWEKNESVLNNTCMHKFRTWNDVNHWLMRYWQLEQGKFVPQRHNFGKYLEITQPDEIKSVLEQAKIKTLCINDNVFVDDGKAEEVFSTIESSLKNKFPKKSQFEK
ncbi:stealth family protein [Pediococcus parvulus]|uniref:stealth family protein n=1 Tax=Pediococcus parvulus TaxID=54062 RepID=UPI0021A94F06|nr:stealth family protein [Pediococcus parvulus]MCT3034572.1 capsule biosynthesis protein CapG [Pediococcus parvulus]